MSTAKANAFVNLSLWSQSPSGPTYPAVWNKTSVRLTGITVTITDTNPTFTSPKTYRFTSNFNVIIGGATYAVTFDVTATYSSQGSYLTSINSFTVSGTNGSFIVPCHCDIAVSNIVSVVNSIPVFSRDFIKKNVTFPSGNPGMTATYSDINFATVTKDTPPADITGTLSYDNGTCMMTVNTEIMNGDNFATAIGGQFAKYAQMIPLYDTVSDTVNPYIDSNIKSLVIKVPSKSGMSFAYREIHSNEWIVNSNCPAAVSTVQDTLRCGVRIVSYPTSKTTAYLNPGSYNWDMTPP